MTVLKMNEQIATRFDHEIAHRGLKISSALNMLRTQQYPPDARKGLRKFQLAEVADLIGVTQSHLRQIHSEGKGPEIETISGRRYYTAQQMLELRSYLEDNKKSDKRIYHPQRRPGNLSVFFLLSILKAVLAKRQQQPTLLSISRLPDTVFWLSIWIPGPL